MKIQFHIPHDSLLKTYDTIIQILHGYDSLIFNAMNLIDRRFIPPVDPSNYAEKHLEIKNKLKYSAALKGREKTLLLFQQLWKNIIGIGGIPGINSQHLLDNISFSTNFQDINFKLSTNGYWAVEWSIPYPSYNLESKNVILEIMEYNIGWDEIVPKYIVEYVSSALEAYKNGMYASSLALLSIAVEATLRDALATLGYTFQRGASSVDEFPFEKAEIQVIGNSYSVTFLNTMPKIPSEFPTSLGGSNSVKIDIKRKINQQKNRIDLIIKAPASFVDHWSSNIPMRSAQKKVNGLGEALHIARNIEQILTPDILPIDFDEVIQTVRNNLIHLSGETLNKELRDFSTPNQVFTLGNFLDEQEMVFDLVSNIPQFINTQYVSLYKNTCSILNPTP